MGIFVVSLCKTVVLDERIVEADTPEQAKEKAFMTFHKFDRNDSEFEEVRCPKCEYRYQNGDTEIECCCDEGELQEWVEDNKVNVIV